MKKTYINPEMVTVRLAHTLLNPTSPLDIVNQDATMTGTDYEDVKSNQASYNVWDDDWSK